MNEWHQFKLEELAEVDPDKLSETTDKEYRFRYLDIGSVKANVISLPSHEITFGGSPSRARKPVMTGDVLMSTVRPNLKAFAYFDFDVKNCVASTGFAVLRAKPSSNDRFILYSILSDETTRQIESLVVGSNYPAINTGEVRKLKVCAPKCKDEQAKIAEILSTVDRAIEQTQGLIAKQQRIKTGLMQDLLTRGIDSSGNLRSCLLYTSPSPRD